MENIWGQLIPGYTQALSEQAVGLTPYLVNNSKGVVVVLPGGGYTMLAPWEGENIALWLNTLGISAFVLSYRVAPYEITYSAKDALRAIKYVRYNSDTYGVDKDKIGVIGFSAGGHLASVISVHSEDIDIQVNDDIGHVSGRPDAAILCYPVITCENTGDDSEQSHELPEVQQRLMEYFSTEKWVNSKTPPTFIWHTADDKVVSVQNSLVYARALSEQAIPFELHVFPSGRHGLNLASDAPDVAVWKELYRRWLANLGFCK